MRNKLKFILCSLILLITNSSLASIVTTYSVNSKVMKEIGEWVDKDTIVFIDLDETLMTPKSLMFSHNSNPYRFFIDDLIRRGERVDHYNVTAAKWYQQRQLKIVEEGWPDYIRALKKRGAIVYGICKMPLHLLNIEEKRYLDLKDLGIIFTNKINDSEFVEIEKKEAWFSLFHKGIIFTGPYSRSHTLLEFFKVTNVVPKKLVFISNFEDEIKRVDKKLRVFRMDFRNVFYLAVKELSGKPNAKTVKFQQQQLLHSGVWMEDEQADAALEQYEKEQLKEIVK